MLAIYILCIYIYNYIIHIYIDIILYIYYIIYIHIIHIYIYILYILYIIYKYIYIYIYYIYILIIHIFFAKGHYWYMLVSANWRVLFNHRFSMVSSLNRTNVWTILESPLVPRFLETKHRMCHGQTVVCFPIKEDDHPFHCVVLISFFGNPIHDDGMTLAHNSHVSWRSWLC